jgi:hypothetical protein
MNEMMNEMMNIESLAQCTDDELGMLILELMSGTIPGEAAFCETILSHTSPALVEAIEALDDEQIYALVEQVARLLKQRCFICDDSNYFAEELAAKHTLQQLFTMAESF